jgi:hypothetical protein
MSSSAKARQPLHLDPSPSVDAESSGRYSVFRQSDLQMLDTLPMHVMARAYRAAWRTLYEIDPWGRHPIPSLDLVIYFHDGRS